MKQTKLGGSLIKMKTEETDKQESCWYTEDFCKLCNASVATNGKKIWCSNKICKLCKPHTKSEMRRLSVQFKDE